MKKLGLYIHIPFCQSKCAYCDFYSVTGYDKFQRYTDAVLLQMEDYSSAASVYEVDTIFIGGGTPTVVPEKNILEIIDGTYSNFNILINAEVTIEANPATVTLPMLKKFMRSGINRISFGVQSTCNNELKSLSRIHTYEDFEKSFNLARKANFNNINVDIMYGIPEQTLESFKLTLNRICALGPEHISVYGLKIEEGTPFSQIKDSLLLPDEDTEFKMYEYAVDYLNANGYKQYEISNFAKPGMECRHNLKYWTCQEYLGLGPASHSYFNNTRFSFKCDIENYIEALEDADSTIDITDKNYPILPSERVGEYIMLNLRLKKGINIIEFKKMFGLDFEDMYKDLLGAYVENGFMDKTGNGYAFTTKGMYVSNYILSAMLDFDSEIDINIANGLDK